MLDMHIYDTYNTYNIYRRNYKKIGNEICSFGQNETFLHKLFSLVH